MKRFARYVLATMVAGTTVLHGIPAGAQDDDGDYEQDAAPGDYQEALTPYGDWIDHAEYGRVWHPRVAVGWQPYYEGHWAWSPYGWTWISSEPWGWTFHYGRWSYAPVWGWVWVPGTAWGPAWVDWYWEDGYVGCAPLSPFASHVTIVNQFVFVRERDFCSTRIGRIVVDHGRLPRRVSDHWRYRDFGRGFRAPDRGRIERVSSHPVPRFDNKPPQTVAPRRFRDGDRLARPRNTPDPGQARRGGWQRGGGRADDAVDARPRAGHGDTDAGPAPGRDRGGARPRQGRGNDLGTRPRAGSDPTVAGRGPRLSPPDPAPAFDAPDGGRRGRRQGDDPIVRGGTRQNPLGYRRPAPPAVPGGIMTPQHGGGQARERAVPRNGGIDSGGRGFGGARGRGEGGSSGREARGGGGGRGDRGRRPDGGGRGDGGGFQSGMR